MENVFLLNLGFTFILVLLGLMFLEGIWHKKGKLLKSFLDIDNLFFPRLRDRRVLKSGDRLAFLICILMAVLTFLNGVFSSAFAWMPNVSAVFLFIAIVLTWPIRIIFILVYRSRDYEEIPKFWPFNEKEVTR